MGYPDFHIYIYRERETEREREREREREGGREGGREREYIPSSTFFYKTIIDRGLVSQIRCRPSSACTTSPARLPSRPDQQPCIRETCQYAS